MKARRQLGYGLAIAALVGLIGWLAREAGDASRVDGTIDVESAARAPGTLTDEAARSAALPSWFDAEPLDMASISVEPVDPSRSAPSLDERLRPTSLTGRIVDHHDQPIAGARVLLLPDARSLELMGHTPGSLPEADLSFADLSATTSGADGRFELHGHSAVDSADYLWFADGERGTQVLVLVPGRALCAHRCEHYTGGDYDAGDIRVEVEGGTVTARFVDEEGRGVEGVRVVLYWDVIAELQDHPDLDLSLPTSVASISGADGQLELSGMWPGSGDLRFKSENYLPDRIPGVSVSAGEVARLPDVVLHRAGVLRGRVVDADGRPVAGAEVWPVNLEWADWRVEHAGITGLDQGDVAAGWIEDREALRGAPDPLSPVSTDGDGRFERGGLDDSEYIVLIEAAGFDPVAVPKAVPGQSIEVTLQHEASLRVTAVAPGGSELVPLDAVRAFRLDTARSAGAREPPIRTAIPAQIVGGTTAVVSRAGRLATEVELGAAGFATQVFELAGVAAPGVLEQQVELTPEARLSGSVLDEDGHPVADVDLKLVRNGVREKDQIPPRAVTNASGHFAFSGLAAGDWKLTASKTGYLEEGIDTIAVAAAIANPDVELVLHREGVISGRVWEADGRPAAGVEVRTWIVTSGGLGGIPAATDAEGRFEVRGLAAATYHFLVPPGPEVEVPLEAGQHLEIELHRRAPPVVRGRVLAGDAPQPGVKVVLERDERAWMVLAPKPRRTNAHGEFEWQLEVDGSYRLHAERDQGSVTPNVLFAVGYGDRFETDLVFGAGSIEGRVQVAGAADASLEGVRVHLSGDAIGDWRPVELDGRFAFDSLSPGRYVIEASGRTYADCRTPPIELTERQRVRDLVLELSAGARLEGSATRSSGENLDGWIVYAVSTGDLFQHSASIEAGRYAISGLGLGEYRVVIAPPEGVDWGSLMANREDLEAAGHLTPPVPVQIEAIQIYHLDLTQP